MNADQLRPITPGDLHPVDRCAWCGAHLSRNLLSAPTPRVETRRILWTLAPGPVCIDRVGCARRRERSRRAVP
jgi:hypothetical protein